ncbi:MAG TPA: hypothetical protein VHN20_01680 [Beijerinckiaceae bacterium]|nr:hypothetical protein [Beijerinckiaceae bacterium]
MESTRLAERELASGRLVMPLTRTSVPIRYVGHNLVFPRYVRQRQALKVFTDWLLAELALKAQSPPGNSADAPRAA